VLWDAGDGRLRPLAVLGEPGPAVRCVLRGPKLPAAVCGPATHGRTRRASSHAPLPCPHGPARRLARSPPSAPLLPSRSPARSGLVVLPELATLVSAAADGQLGVWPLPRPAMALLPLPGLAPPAWTLRRGIVRVHRNRLSAISR
jgi:hypothetical protein